MLERLRGIGRGTARLVRAEGESLLVRARRSAAWTMVIVLGGVMLVAGGGAVLVSAGALLSTELGWVAAVAILGAVVLLLGAVVAGTGWALMHRAMRREAVPREIRADAELARRELHGERAGPAAGGPAAPAAASAAPASHDGWTEDVKRFVARHPAEVAGGALCIVALLGPTRSIRMLGRAAMVAGVVQKLGDLQPEPVRTAGTPAAARPPAGPRPASTVEGTPAARPASSPRTDHDRRIRPVPPRPVAIPRAH